MADGHSRLAVHRTVVVVDVEKYGDPGRTDRDRLAVRTGLYATLTRAFQRAGAQWSSCYHDDCGDGVLVLVPPDVPKSIFAGPLLIELADALREHNAEHPEPQRIRLRMVLHAGEVSHDEHGIVATSVNVAFRLIEARELRTSLATSPGSLAVMVSSWFFDEVVRHSATDAASYRPVQVTVKETTAIGWIHLPDAPYPREVASATRPADPPHQLPAGPAHFTGRTAELAELSAAVANQEDGPLLRVITGVGGVGKTALALHWLNEHRHRFPDGTFHLDLQAFAPGGPRSSEEALDHLLRSLGVEPDRIPAKLSEMAALFRSTTADRSLAVLLDDAAAAEQVRPLLPGAGHSLVVVTSRRRLTGLVTEGAAFVPLATLDHAVALRLLAALVSTERIQAERERADELADLCAGLPLAICIGAAQLALRPHWPLEHLTSRLTDIRTRLDRLSVRDDRSVQVVLNMSYQALSTDAARLYRRLGLHPGDDFPLGVAAAAVDTSVDSANDLVEELVDASLVDEISQDRFRFHGLVQLHARGLAEREETDADRRAAGTRMLEWFLRSAVAADRMLRPGRRRPHYPFLDSHTEASVFADQRAGLAWLETEQSNLVAVVRRASADESFDLAWHVCDAAWPLRYRTHHVNMVRLCELGVEAATSGGNEFGIARMTFRLGLLYMDAGDHTKAREHMRAALAMREALDDTRGAGSVREGLGLLALEAGRPAEAVEMLNAVLRENHAGGDPRRIARVLLNLGRALLAGGDIDGATTRLDQARHWFAEASDDDSYNAARLGLILGQAHRMRHRPDLAATYVHLSMSSMRRLGGIFGEAEAFEELGRIASHLGDLTSAREARKEAALVYERLGAAGHARLRRHSEE